MPVIQTIATHHFRVPLTELLSDAKHGDQSHFERSRSRYGWTMATGEPPCKMAGAAGW